MKRKNERLKVQKRWRRIEGRAGRCQARDRTSMSGPRTTQCPCPPIRHSGRLLSPRTNCSFNYQTHRQTCIGTSSATSSPPGAVLKWYSPAVQKAAGPSLKWICWNGLNEFGQKLKDGNVGCCLSLCESNVSLVTKKEQATESSVLGVGCAVLFANEINILIFHPIHSEY